MNQPCFKKSLEKWLLGLNCQFHCMVLTLYQILGLSGRATILNISDTMAILTTIYLSVNVTSVHRMLRVLLLLLLTVEFKCNEST